MDLSLILGIIIGLLLAIVANTFSGDWRSASNYYKETLEEAVKRKLPHKMGEIVGLSEAEENFKNSLKQTEDTKIL